MSCKIEGCENQGKLHRMGHRYFPRGYCSTHYKKWVKENREIIENDSKPVERCSVENCENEAPFKRGMCNKHYIRFIKHGDPNAIEKRREGQTKHSLYATYGGMKKRCLNETDKDYKNYGGRGINICDRWLGVDGFFNFIEDMGDRPENTTLDRKNVEGDYSPENCRWATLNEQASNKRDSKNVGISYYKSINKYRVRLSVKGVTYNLGFYEDLEEAVQARKDGEIKYL